MFPGHPSDREEWAELHLQSRHGPVAAFRRCPVPPAERHCVRSNGTDFSRYLQVGDRHKTYF